MRHQFVRTASLATAGAMALGLFSLVPARAAQAGVPADCEMLVRVVYGYYSDWYKEADVTGRNCSPTTRGIRVQNTFGADSSCKTVGPGKTATWHEYLIFGKVPKRIVYC